CIFQFLTENLKVKVNMRYVYYFLDKMGFRLKVATKIHYKYDEEEVKGFIKSLRARLQKYTDQGYSVLYMDETHQKLGDGLQGYAFGGDEAYSDHSASTRRTAYTYIVYMGLKMISVTEVCTTMTSQLFITSLENLAFKYPNKKFLIILDNAPVHTSKEVEDWLKKCRNKKKFAFLYLPKYAPKLNPVEYFNNDFKGEMRKKVAHTKKELLQNAREFIHKFVDDNNNTLPSAVPKISSYFRAKHCKYFINIYSQVLKSYCTKVKVAKKLLQKLSWRFKNITLDMLISNVKALLKELSKKEREPVQRCLDYYSKASNQLNILIYRS
ncbi:MAG: IS630 family transposase, partial [Desulfovibrionaceae bacterium]|nr:IS630 family transposase [Desulfovibrionaceae bacterium]